MKWCAGRIAAALMCLTAVSPVVGGDTPHWHKIKSANFELYTTAGERSGREVAQRFEQVRSFFMEAMGLGLKTGPPVRIVVFRSDKEFAPYAFNDFVTAFYLGAGERDYIVMKSAASEQFPVAVHEYIHLLVKHTGIVAPVWFNEGLAEFYSNLKPVGGKIEVGDLITRHLAMLRQSKWIDLPALLAVRHDSPLYNEKAHAGVFYAESWALVHMLYLGEPYRAKLPVLLSGIKAGADMPETFEKAYGKPLDQVQKDLGNYVGRTSFNASLFNTKLAREVAAPEVSEPSALQAALVLTEILANMEAKAGEARAGYRQLERDYPKEWQVERGLARLSMREGKRTEAMEHYARAMELGATGASVYVDYGRLLRVLGRHAEAVGVLKRATELDPENREARLELGYAYVINNQHEEALKQLLMVKQVSAEQAFGYLHAIAYAYYRLDHMAEAAAAAAKCRQYAKTPEQTMRLDQLVAELEYIPKYPLVGGDHPAKESAAGRDDPADAPPPKLQRRTGTAVAEGVLKQVDCLGNRFRLGILVGEDNMSFALLNPAAVKTINDAPLDFSCGAQRPRRIRIEYEAREGAMEGTVGVVRGIEFVE